MLAGLGQDVDVTLFLQPGSNLYDPAKELLERYAAKSSRVKLRVVDPERNLAEAQTLVDRYQIQSLNVVVFESGGDRRVVEESALADYDYSGVQFGQGPTLTGFKGEEAFTGAILELVEKRKPRVLWTTGHGEASLDDAGEQGLSQLRDLLGQENLEMTSWASLSARATVPDGHRPGGRRRPARRLRRARARHARPLSRRRRPPARAARSGARRPGRPASRPASRAGSPDAASKSAPTWSSIRRRPCPSTATRRSSSAPSGARRWSRSLAQAKLPVIVPLARSVRLGPLPAGIEGQTLLQTSAEGWGERDLANLRGVAKDDDDIAGPVAGRRSRRGEDGTSRSRSTRRDLDGEKAAAEPAPAAAAAPSRSRRGAWWWSATPTSLRNGAIANVGNPTLAANAFNWLLERQKLIGIGPKKPEQVRLTLTPGQLSAITWLSLAGLPALAIVAGVAVYFRRRR